MEPRWGGDRPKRGQRSPEDWNGVGMKQGLGSDEFLQGQEPSWEAASCYHGLNLELTPLEPGRRRAFLKNQETPLKRPRVVTALIWT